MAEEMAERRKQDGNAALLVRARLHASSAASPASCEEREQRAQVNSLSSSPARRRWKRACAERSWR
jgi:hypothetical protein